MTTTGQTLDELAGEAMELLGLVKVHGYDPIFRPDEWAARRDAVTARYRDLAARRSVHVGGGGRAGSARESGVDVRAIVGDVLRATPAAHQSYHTDPSMRHGIEVATGVLSIVAAVLVDEGDTAELAAHIVHLAAHRLSENTPPPGVDMDTLGRANVALDDLDPERLSAPGRDDR